MNGASLYHIWNDFLYIDIQIRKLIVSYYNFHIVLMIVIMKDRVLQISDTFLPSLSLLSLSALPCFRSVSRRYSRWMWVWRVQHSKPLSRPSSNWRASTMTTILRYFQKFWWSWVSDIKGNRNKFHLNCIYRYDLVVFYYFILPIRDLCTILLN